MMQIVESVTVSHIHRKKTMGMLLLLPIYFETKNMGYQKTSSGTIAWNTHTQTNRKINANKIDQVIN